MLGLQMRDASSLSLSAVELKDPADLDAATRGCACLSAPRSIFKMALALTLAMPLGACSLSRTAALEDERALVTSSITKPVAAEGIDSTDVEVIKNTVATADFAMAPELAWSNPDTGSRGTIKAIDKFVGSHGQKCKKFQTTVDSFTGISLYNGETCEARKDSWVLSWFTRE